MQFQSHQYFDDLQIYCRYSPAGTFGLADPSWYMSMMSLAAKDTVHLQSNAEKTELVRCATSRRLNRLVYSTDQDRVSAHLALFFSLQSQHLQ